MAHPMPRSPPVKKAIFPARFVMMGGAPLNQIYRGASTVLSQHGHFQKNNADDLCALRLLRVIGLSDHATIVVTSAMHMGMPKYPDLATFIVSTARKRTAFAICSMFVRELVVDVFMSSPRKCPTKKRQYRTDKKIYSDIILLS